MKSDTTEQVRPVRVAITMPVITEKGARDSEESERAATMKQIDLLTFSLEVWMRIDFTLLPLLTFLLKRAD